jgi:hypothetical protein
VWLRKEAGGTTITWEGRQYNWPVTDPVCEVPQGLGQELLNIHGAGYSEAPAPPKPEPKASPPKAAADPAQK